VPALMPARTILLVEDDHVLVDLLTAELATRNYAVVHAETGKQALAVIVGERVDLVLLDLTLPDVDGMILCTELRRLTSVPIVVCSGRSGQAERVLSLRLGADDFVPKPFDLDELAARIEAALRRGGAAVPATPAHAAAHANTDEQQVAHLDPLQQCLVWHGQPVPLTPTEYQLLALLIAHAGDTVPRTDLEQRLGTDDASPNPLGITAHISRLRSKLGRLGPAAPRIVPVRGAGYQLQRFTNVR
jgi:DNA-binding response OmpR family regulator